MDDNPDKTVRRTRAEWQRLVRQWHRSGRTAHDFASERGIEPRLLSWWKWRFSRDVARSGPATGRRQADIRLVPVEVTESPAATHDDVAWELTTTSGDRLRVRGPMTRADLSAVLAALMREDRRR